MEETDSNYLRQRFSTWVMTSLGMNHPFTRVTYQIPDITVHKISRIAVMK